MDPAWGSEFRERMKLFESKRFSDEGVVSASVKVRVVSGCFHREHSPHAYGLIDKRLASSVLRGSDVAFVEHESGPELLVYLALGTAGVTLAKSVIDLIVTIIKARSEGIKKGDRPSDPIELIVRRIGDSDKFLEERILRIGHGDSVSREDIEIQINEALNRLVEPKKTKRARTAARRPRRKG